MAISHFLWRVLCLTVMQATLPSVYTSNSAAQLFNGLNVDKYIPGGTPSGLTLDELLTGPLALPGLDLQFSRGSGLFNRGASCDPLLDVAPNAASMLGICARATGPTVTPSEWGRFHADGSHGAIISVSDTPCTDADGCPSAGETLCAHHLLPVQPGVSLTSLLANSGVVEVNCAGAVGRYLRISLPGENERVLPISTVVHVHRARAPSPNPSSATEKRPTVCYGVQPRPKGTSGEELLAASKKHEFLIAPTNPQDPIFYSSCYSYDVIKTWLPIGNESDAVATTQRHLDSHCLACECVRENLIQAYNISELRTLHWWLQLNGTCGACEPPPPSPLPPTTPPPPREEVTASCSTACVQQCTYSCQVPDAFDRCVGAASNRCPCPPPQPWCSAKR